MIILLDDTVFSELENNNNGLYRNILNILYNDELKIILNKDLLDLYSTKINNDTFFQSFITELIDQKRNVEPMTHKKANYSKDELFTKLYENYNNPFIIPICVDRSTEYT
ncbi:hypothetical protein AB4Y90_17820, partial [Chryseobacterium sp. 2TAF14]|uniref:hypothetical protein n=1 Tax=Chryseobacterium sp. 2TAF14 TaxID=3233007 RepID=UPI003F92C4B7